MRVYAQQSEATVSHFRTHRSDRDVDLVVERDDGRIVAVEVKLSSVINDSDVGHLVRLRQRLATDLLDCAVITAGTEAYRRADGIAVTPAALLSP